MYTFEEEFNRYKRFCNKQYLATKECFSLMYDSLLEDLTQCVFVYTNDENTIKHLHKFYKVIEKNTVSSDLYLGYEYIHNCVL